MLVQNWLHVSFAIEFRYSDLASHNLEPSTTTAAP
jgi:hypothetical protein